MILNRLYKFIFVILLLCQPLYAAENIVEFTDDSLPILNDELKGLTIESQVKENNGLNLQSKKITSLATPTSDTDAATKKYVDDNATGVIVQIVNVMDGAVATGSTTMSYSGDSIPTNTAGDEYMSLTITPTSATNKLRIDVIAVVSGVPGANNYMSGALFQDTTANALAATTHDCQSSNFIMHIAFTHFMTAGTTDATTFKVRIGSNSVGTITFNGTNGGRIHGGVCASSITITEISV